MLLLLVLTVMLPVTLAADPVEKHLYFEGYGIKIAGRSGKISFVKMPPGNDTMMKPGGNNTMMPPKGDKPPKPKAIEFWMESLTEMDAESMVVGESKTPKHTFNSFASQDFTFGDIVDDYAIGDTKAMKLTYTGMLKDASSKIEVDVFLIKADGTLNIGGETNTLEKGQMKFSFKLSNWVFCTSLTCSNADVDKPRIGEEGAFVDLAISVKAKQAPKEEGERQMGKPVKFDLGDGDIYLSQKVQIDDEWQDMATGYPKYEEDGAKRTFTFRFPRFNSTAFYDPTVTVDEPEDRTSGVETTGVSFVSLMAAIFIAALLQRLD